MAEWNFGGYTAEDIQFVDGGAGLAPGALFRVDPALVAARDALTFRVTDDDGLLEATDDGQQAVVSDATGTVVAMGVLRTDLAATLTTPEGTVVTLHRVTVDGQVAGYLASGPLTPGVTYRIEDVLPEGTALDYTQVTGPSRAPDAAETLAGGAEADSLLGGGGDDSVNGGAGRDTVFGEAGNDTIDAGAGNDVVFGGSGNDTVQLGDGDDRFGSHSGEGGNDLIQGGGGNDDLNGGAGNDTLEGGAGDDSLVGGIGNDWLYGGAGRDHFSITDNHNTDQIDGGEQDSEWDVVYFSNFGSRQGVHLHFGSGQSGSYDFLGTAGGGNFTGIEVFSTTGFDDFIDGRSANEFIWASANAGNDLIYGGSSGDTLRGGADEDTLEGRAGNDQLWGEDGADRFILDAGSGRDTIEGGEGGFDRDTLDYSAEAGPVTVTFSGSERGVAQAGTARADFAGIERIELGSGNDSVDATASEWSLEVSGGAGDDTLRGGSGDDLIEGGAGNDSLVGGAGADSFVIGAGSGSDTVEGGSGAGEPDTLDFSTMTEALIVTFTGDGAGTAAAGAGGTVFSGVERVELGAGDDSVDGTASATALELRGWDGADTIRGGAGDDRLDGDGGDDVIAGGGGADTLQGGAGSDTLTGGAGADTFVVLSGDGAMRITDFDFTLTGTQTADRIDLSALRAPGGGPVKRDDITLSEDADGNAVMSFPMGESITFEGVPASRIAEPGAMAAMGIACFAAGTPIATPGGPRPVEALRPGDLVLTRDDGPQPVLWCGARRLGPEALAHWPALRPVRVRGAETDLVMSPQHALALRGGDGREVLVRARHLAELGQGRARVMRGCRRIAYHHFLLPRHGLVWAAGLLAESFWPGDVALGTLEPGARSALDAVLRRLDEARAGAPYGPRARPLLSRREAERLFAAAPTRRDCAVRLP